MGKNNTYTVEDHKTAFNYWYETRNMAAASREVGADWLTIKRWASDDYSCIHGCPWHDWEELMIERDKALALRQDLLEKGVVDPVQHDVVVREAAVHKINGQPTISDIVRSDLERLAQWEFLWSKVYFDATGLVTDWRVARGIDPVLNASETETYDPSARQSLRKGLHCTTLDQAIRNLAKIQEAIDSIKENRSVRHDVLSDDEEETQFSIEELRRMRLMVRESSPDTIRALLTVKDEPGEKKQG